MEESSSIFIIHNNATAWMVVGIVFIVSAALLFCLSVYLYVQRRRSVDEIRRLDLQVITLQQQLEEQNPPAYGIQSKIGGHI